MSAPYTDSNRLSYTKSLLIIHHLLLPMWFRIKGHDTAKGNKVFT